MSMKRNNHSVNVGEGVDSDSTISLMIVASCVSGRGQALDILMMGLHWNIPDSFMVVRLSHTRQARARELPDSFIQREPLPPELGVPLKNQTGTVVVVGNLT